MKNSKAITIYLAITGLMLTFIGGATLLMPVEMKATAGLQIADNINLLNEVRGESAWLLVTALIALVSLFVHKLKYSSMIMVITAFGAIGVGRLISILVDGMPIESLVKATVLEFVVAAIGLVLFKIHQEK